MSRIRQLGRFTKRHAKYHLYGSKFRHTARYRHRLLVIAASVALLVGAGGGYLYWRHGPPEPSHTVSKTSPIKQSPSPPPIAAPTVPAKAYGIAAGSSLTTLTGAALDSRVKAIADLGVTWVRYDFDWSLIQPASARSYTWARYDELVAVSNKYHLHVLGILDYTPVWARQNGCDDSHCPPADTAKFATFASAVAARYKSKGVQTWEIWNEPNSKDFWSPTASPADYVRLLEQSYTAIKKQDAQALVMTAGLSPHSTDGSSYAPVDFIKQVYALGGQGSFDAVADHPYTFPLSPTSSADHAWNQMAAETGSIRQLMVANGDSQKKIWITEFGAPTGGPGPISTIANPNLSEHPFVVDEALQAKILSDALQLYSGYDWVGPFFVYSIQDAGTSQDTNENFFGLLRHDGSQKPAYAVFQRAAQAN